MRDPARRTFPAPRNVPPPTERELSVARFMDRKDGARAL